MAKEIGIAELASMLKGRIAGSFDEGMMVTGTCAIDNYIENKLSFVKNRKYDKVLARLQNAVILIPEDLIEFCKNYPQNIYVIVKDVVNSLMDIQDFFYRDHILITEEGISQTAKIDSTANICKNVYIGENVWIGKDVIIGGGVKILHNSCISDGVTIGSGSYIHPNVSIYENSQIGCNCIIDSGVCMGAAGFRIEQDIKRKVVRRMLHAGRVIIGDRVEIGANSAIDRATFEDDATLLSDDVKIDNLVHIGHNAQIGARTIIAALSCIGGSDKIGEDVWIGIGVTTSNGINIGNRAKILLNAVVAYDVAEDEMVSGFYAMPHRQWKRVYERLKEDFYG